MLIRVAVFAATALAIPPHHGPGDRRAGPDAAQVTTLLVTLERTDPVVCEMAVDAFGHGWYGWVRASGVGALGEVPESQRETQARMRRGGYRPASRTAPAASQPSTTSAGVPHSTNTSRVC